LHGLNFERFIGTQAEVLVERVAIDERQTFRKNGDAGLDGLEGVAADVRLGADIKDAGNRRCERKLIGGVDVMG
jgi:hypothetical protein